MSNKNKNGKHDKALTIIVFATAILNLVHEIIELLKTLLE